MEIVDSRSALLSNYEVLTLLKEHESEQLIKAKTAIRVKKEEEQAGEVGARSNVIDDVTENLRTVEFEAIQYLSADYHAIRLQTEASITQLIKDLEPFDLTKAEKLQIVNLAPTEPVELYVIVEEIEDRLNERMNDVLDVVRKSVSATKRAETGDSNRNIGNFTMQGDTEVEHLVVARNNLEDKSVMEQDYDEQGWEEDAEHEIFMDTGEGAGVEGDLEMDDE